MNDSEVSRREVLGAGVAGTLALTLPASLAAAEPEGVTAPVRTTGGLVRGRRIDGVNVYKGIPYAGSVSGSARFLPAPPAPQWPGIRDAFDFGPMAPQPPSPLLAELAQSTSPKTSEQDCLTVNVWSPVEPGANRPVLVNIHGGAFTYGSGTIDYVTLSPAQLREHKIVLVTLNYRLGALGLLYLREIAGPAYRQSGSIAIADQIMALKWVQDNIAAFGGDPRRVTIAGQSAGGASVSTLLTAAGTNGLFRQAVDEYGPIGAGQSPQNASRIAHRFLEALGIAPGAWRNLFDVPVAQILRAQAAVGDPMGIIKGDKIWVPVADGTFLPARPLAGLAASRRKVSLITGCNHDHMGFLTRMIPTLLPPNRPNVLEEWLRPILAARTEAVVAHFRTAYPGRNSGDILLTILSELFRGGLVSPAEAWVRSGNPVWHYMSTTGQHEGVPKERLARFVLSGIPNPPGAPPWPRYDIANRSTLVVDTAERIERDPFGADRAAVAGIHYGA